MVHILRYLMDVDEIWYRRSRLRNILVGLILDIPSHKLSLQSLLKLFFI